jgi:hypothetical protein
MVPLLIGNETMRPVWQSLHTMYQKTKGTLQLSTFADTVVINHHCVGGQPSISTGEKSHIFRDFAAGNHAAANEIPPPR